MTLKIDIHVTADPDYWGPEFNEKMAADAATIHADNLKAWCLEQWPDAEVKVRFGFDGKSVTAYDKGVEQPAVIWLIDDHGEETWAEVAEQVIQKNV